MYRFFNKDSFLLLLVVFASHILAQAPSASPPNNAAEYKALVKEYKELTEKHADVLEETIANDPAFARAKYWLENEQLKYNTPALQEDRVFFATLKDEDKKNYRNWRLGLGSNIDMQVLENEWEKHPDSHKALLLWAALDVTLMNRQLQVSEDIGKEPMANGTDKEFLHWVDSIMKQVATQENNIQNSIIEPIAEINDDSQWQKYITYCQEKNANLIEQVPFLEKKLGIKPEMRNNFEKMVVNSVLFETYDNYYRLFYPVELKDIEKNRRKIHNQLMKINPNWWAEEGIESPNTEKSEGDSIAPASRSPFSWIFMGLGIILIVYALVRIFLNKIKKEVPND